MQRGPLIGTDIETIARVISHRLSPSQDRMPVHAASEQGSSWSTSRGMETCQPEETGVPGSA